MKLLALAFCSVLLLRANAQIVTGKLTDKTTGLPLKYVFVSSYSGSTFTNNDGVFRLKISNIFDTIKINSMSYKPFKLATADWGPFMRNVLMEIKYTELGEVTIRAVRNYHKDSVSLRQQYANQFNFRGPRFDEIVHLPSAASPFAGITIDLGNLIKAITKKHSRDYKLQQILLRDERENHVSARFNKTLLGDITRLAGDSLEIFMSRYRPTAVTLDKMSDYDLIQYIKSSQGKFKASDRKNDALPKLLKEGESLE